MSDTTIVTHYFLSYWFIHSWSIRIKRIRNKKYVLSNSESVQCNFFIFDHMTFIQFKICCCIQNFMKIGWFFTEIWRYRFLKWRPSAILVLFHHHMRPPTKSLLLTAAACQIFVNLIHRSEDIAFVVGYLVNQGQRIGPDRRPQRQTV